MKQLFIFDFDHTLFDAQKLRKELGLLIANNKNISSELIWKEFSKPNNKIVKFLQKNAPKYVFPGVVENLQNLKSEKVLLSYGNLQFQKEKIKDSGLYELFDKVILTEENKINFLLEFYQKNKNKEIYLINDTYNKRFNENEEIKKEIPAIKIFEVDNYKPIKQKTILDVFRYIHKNY